MPKKRVITGWRQVTQRKTGLSPAPKSKAVPAKPVAEQVADERWETEGGTLDTPAK